MASKELTICFLVRPDLFTSNAGDTVQIQSLKNELEKIGYKIVIRTELNQLDNDDKFDFAHLFNILRVESALNNLNYAKKMKLPVLITPIYWNALPFFKRERREYVNWWHNTQRIRKNIIKQAELVAANSWQEIDCMQEDFAIDLNAEVYPNGVDSSFFTNAKKLDNKVISVGRFHPRKNQLQAIKALNDLDCDATFIGEVNDPAYFRKCNSIAGDNINFIQGLKQDELKEHYAKAKVHLLPSWYDTPGLANLEAGLAGCQVVTTPNGSTKEYFREFAYYCDHKSINSIKEQINCALKNKENKELQNLILNNFTWEKAARQLSAIYQKFHITVT